jgi:hypothetical protein
MAGEGYRIMPSIWDMYSGRHVRSMNFLNAWASGKPVTATGQTVSEGWLLGRSSDETAAELSRVNASVENYDNKLTDRFGQPEKKKRQDTITIKEETGTPGHRVIFNIDYINESRDVQRTIHEIRLAFQVRRSVFQSHGSHVFSERDASGAVTRQFAWSMDYRQVTYDPIPVEMRWSGTPPITNPASAIH